MTTGKASFELDRLAELWAPRPAVPRAPPPLPAGGDALALAGALEAAIRVAFAPEIDPGGKKLALALAMVEDASRMTSDQKPPTPMRVFDLARAIFPAEGAPAPADLTAYRKQMAALLDDLEDLLDGLAVAVAAPGRAPGGAARG